MFTGVTSTSAYNLRQISNKDGLSNSAILSIYQDTNGLMWFGSCDGLNIFDGSNVNIYKSYDDNNLSGNLIEEIIETEQGTLWLQTNYGLNRLETINKTVNYYSYFIGSTFLKKDKNNTLFILKDDDVVYYYDRQSNQINKIPIRHFDFSELLNCHIDQHNIFYLFFRNGKIARYLIDEDENLKVKIGRAHV